MHPGQPNAHSTVIGRVSVCVSPVSLTHVKDNVPLAVATVVKDDERIGGDGREEVGAENLLAVIGADEAS